MVLAQMQGLLAGLYDASVEHDVRDFLVSDPNLVRELSGNEQAADEQVFVVQEDGSVHVGVYIDSAVLDRLSRCNPMQWLNDANLADYCTALEGVSHFHYLVWSVSRARPVSLLELELQAEVDKYASALTLLTRQDPSRFPAHLYWQLFHRVSFLPELDAQSLLRYQEANRFAARFCRALESRCFKRRLRPEAWLSELRSFYRSGHHEKLRRSDR
jgi:hypothetical protein